LVEIGVVAAEGEKRCIGDKRCYQVDETRAGPFCWGTTPARRCDRHQPDYRGITQEVLDARVAAAKELCRDDAAYRKGRCPNDPTKAPPCPAPPTKADLCGVSGQCLTSQDCPTRKKECWTSCFPCNTVAYCEQQVAAGLVAPQGVTNCSRASHLKISSALALVVLVLLIWI
jgi:hypothetical protein